ncbi:hypothetical protein BASA81_003155 [Batrachochytrium salamandrivorans]|nr:hypothetical protein BASA81_003155 [Batrachochytrium salamandrivorans]
MQGVEDSLSEPNAVVDDELWENQVCPPPFPSPARALTVSHRFGLKKREGINWVPAAAERGRFSDRFARFRFDSLAEAQTSFPAGEFTRTGDWLYSKTFATLENGLAKSGSFTGQSSSSLCRWRKWTRRREIARPASELCVGWLGQKGRSGVWKSRYFILARPVLVCGGGGGGALALPTAAMPNQHDFVDNEDEEPSSNDDDEEEEEDVLKTPLHPSSNQPLLHDPSASPDQLAVNNTAPAVASSSSEPPERVKFFYLRRGLDDPKCAFPSLMDWNDMRKFPRRQIRHIKLPSRGPNRLEDYVGEPKFAIKYLSGRKLVFNAGTVEGKDKWIEMLGEVLGDAEYSPSMGKKFVNAAFSAAKRSQQVMGFSLRRSSSVPVAHTPPSSSTMTVVGHAPSNAPRSSPASPLIYQPVMVELMREPLTGAINIRIAPAEDGKGLVVLEMFDHCREFPTGNYPTDLVVGDHITHVHGELVGTVARFKELIGKGRMVPLQLLRTRAVVPPPTSPRMHFKPPPLSTTSSARFAGSDDSEMDGTSPSPPPSSASAPPPPPLTINNASELGVQSSSESNLLVLPPPMPLRCTTKRTQIPSNPLGLHSAQVRSACLKCLEECGELTYAQLRLQVAKQLQAGELFDSDEWRLFFRDFLDYWVCDGIKYTTGGLDLGDFTPVILRV